MKRFIGSGIAVLLAGSLASCAMDAPEADQFGEQQSGLQADPAAVAAAGMDPLAVVNPAMVEPITAAIQEVETNALDACDTMCTVRAWYTEERYDEAREVLSQELTAAPENIETALALAQVEIADEEYGTAYALVDDALRGEHDVRLLEKRAISSLMAHDVATAAEDYNELLDELEAIDDANMSICSAMSGTCQKKSVTEAQAWAGLAATEYNRGKLDAAERIAEQVLQGDLKGSIDPAHAEFILALTSAKKGDDSKALDHYEAILARYPKEPSTLNNVGGVHFRAGDLGTARAFHQAAYEHAGTHRRIAAIAWANVAEIDMLEGRYDASEEKVLEALATSKNFAYGHMLAAVLYDVTQKPNKAAQHLARGLALDEQGVTRFNTTWFDNDWSTHFAALVAEQEGNSAEAIELFTQLASSDNELLAAAAERHLILAQR